MPNHGSKVKTMGPLFQANPTLKTFHIYSTNKFMPSVHKSPMLSIHLPSHQIKSHSVAPRCHIIQPMISSKCVFEDNKSIFKEALEVSGLRLLWGYIECLLSLLFTLCHNRWMPLHPLDPKVSTINTFWGNPSFIFATSWGNPRVGFSSSSHAAGTSLLPFIPRSCYKVVFWFTAFIDSEWGFCLLQTTYKMLLSHAVISFCHQGSILMVKEIV